MTMGSFPPVTDGDPRGARIRSLIAEARTLAAEQVVELERALLQVGLLAAQVVEGGDIYPPGLREIARRLADDAPWATQTLAAIRQRTLDHDSASANRVAQPALRDSETGLVAPERRSFAPEGESFDLADPAVGLVRSDSTGLDDEAVDVAAEAEAPSSLSDALRGKFRSRAAA